MCALCAANLPTYAEDRSSPGRISIATLSPRKSSRDGIAMQPAERASIRRTAFQVAGTFPLVLPSILCFFGRFEKGGWVCYGIVKVPFVFVGGVGVMEMIKFATENISEQV